VTTWRGGEQIIPRPPEWRKGESPHWLTNDTTQHIPAMDVVASRIASREVASKVTSQEFSQEWISTARLSAVLVPLVNTDDGPSIILTKRASHLKNHKGEISFPGGRVEEAESPRGAALRETEEEIGLLSLNVDIVGQLDPLTTFVSNSVIVPFVGHVHTLNELVANDGEVARILVVPIIELMRADTYWNEWWPTPRGDLNIHFFALDDETIWGATARILRQFIDVAIAPSLQGPA
jgi:8-oxo-dGTP pyrophosphatase MutT (NUDIX family)